MGQPQQVKATIQFITDYHRHSGGGMDDLVRLTPPKRQKFLNECLDQLHGGRIEDFKKTLESPEFNPTLTFEAGTQHPSLASIRAAIEIAIEKYNAGEFPLQFALESHEHEHEAGRHALAAAAVRPPDCVQWFWEGDKKVYKYNWDGVVLSTVERAQAAGQKPVEQKTSGPKPRYRLSLIYR